MPIYKLAPVSYRENGDPNSHDYNKIYSSDFTFTLTGAVTVKSFDSKPGRTITRSLKRERMIDPPELAYYLVPEWQDDVIEYISRLQMAKEMKVFQTDQTLIYHSLVKSNRTDVVVNLTKLEREDLDEFVKFLRTNETTNGKRNEGLSN